MNNFQLLKLNEIANKMGYGTVQSFSKMYKGGTLNAFGSLNCSFTMFTIKLNVENLCIGIDVNETYLKPTKQSNKINKVCDLENPKELHEVLGLIYF